MRQFWETFPLFQIAPQPVPQIGKGPNLGENKIAPQLVAQIGKGVILGENDEIAAIILNKRDGKDISTFLRIVQKSREEYTGHLKSSHNMRLSYVLSHPLVILQQLVAQIGIGDNFWVKMKSRHKLWRRSEKALFLSKTKSCNKLLHILGKGSIRAKKKEGDDEINDEINDEIKEDIIGLDLAIRRIVAKRSGIKAKEEISRSRIYNIWACRKNASIYIRVVRFKRSSPPA